MLEHEKDRLQVLITAEEAFPALEAAFLDANSTISAGFRIFDPMTRLRSARARAVGQTWGDLLVDTLNRGVDVTLLISDFDPVNGTDLHRGTWRTMRILCGLREMTRDGAGRLIARALLHPAQLAPLMRVAFAPMARGKLRAAVEQHGADILRGAPGVRPWFTDKEGTPSLRRFALPRQFPATHHHKLAVFDQQRLYIGGLDLNERRYDTQHHDQPAQQTWHDVQVLIDDPTLARAGQTYLNSFPNTVAGAKPPPPVAGFLRTQSARRRVSLAHISPRSALRELRTAHVEQIATAKRLIYLETQFFRDRDIARALCRAAHANPDLTLILTLPGAPEDVAFHGSGALEARFGENLQARCIAKVQRAFGPRLFIGSPVQPRPVSPADPDEDRAHLSGAPLVYVHSKVSVFDDSAAIVSSANLNGRSLNWDSEAGVLLQRPTEVAQVARRVMGHWLPDEVGPEFYAPATARDAWAAWAAKNDSADPKDQKGFIVPYKSVPARRFGRAVPGVPESMV
ncbi:phospholipase D family protein [Actibacterium lipolyticum]|uniref:Phospholipase D n=1 Tax=Actibacterium lipolyticum TaxID=1524263 RepID=A0A238KJA2_9RHOB|nr:phospholipase D-like domain-containing protein [Actibacterium lipolyticum]SMX42949.1 cardiolipin synthetase [Actibacterium lipolyticum]